MLLVPSVQGRGLYLEHAPWYSPALSDTGLSLGAGMVVADGDTQAVLFPLVLSPLRWGPLRFAVTWGYATVRTANQHAFGFADPKAFGRLRLAGADSAATFALYVEGSARVATAAPALHPFAGSGQELELQGTVSVPPWLGLHLGGGRIWCEPRRDTDLERSDVPHALHAWALLSRRIGSWALAARHDELWMDGARRRTALEASLAWLPQRELRVTAGVRLEVGPQVERVLDHEVSLRFAATLR